MIWQFPFSYIPKRPPLATPAASTAVPGWTQLSMQLAWSGAGDVSEVPSYPGSDWSNGSGRGGGKCVGRCLWAQRRREGLGILSCFGDLKCPQLLLPQHGSKGWSDHATTSPLDLPFIIIITVLSWHLPFNLVLWQKLTIYSCNIGSSLLSPPFLVFLK